MLPELFRTSGLTKSQFSPILDIRFYERRRAECPICSLHLDLFRSRGPVCRFCAPGSGDKRPCFVPCCALLRQERRFLFIAAVPLREKAVTVSISTSPGNQKKERSSMETQSIPWREKVQLIVRFLRGSIHYFVVALLCACLGMVFNALTPQVIRLRWTPSSARSSRRSRRFCSRFCRCCRRRSFTRCGSRPRPCCCWPCCAASATTASARSFRAGRSRSSSASATGCMTTSST